MAITKVEYFNGSTKIGERTSEPFDQFQWANAPAGNHTITAKLYVDGNLAATSSAVNIVVNESTGLPDLMLDTYGGAVGAFSLRKMTNTYSGAAIRVRRSSDNAEQDIAFDADGNLDTASLLSFAGSSDVFVTTWYNQVGVEHATQSAHLNQAKIVNAGSLISKNGRPVLDFAASRYTLGVSRIGNVGFASNDESFTILSVFSTTANNGETLLSKASNVASEREFQVFFIASTEGNNPGIYLQGARTLTGAGLNDGEVHTLSIVSRQDPYPRLGWDSAEELIGSIGDVVETDTPIEIGSRPGSSLAYTGQMMEHVIWDVSKYADIVAIRNNASSYWGI